LCALKKSNDSCLILVCWDRISFRIFPSTSGSWFFMTVFEFIWQFFFQNDVFKLEEVFSEHGIRAFHKKGLGSFQKFLNLQIWDKPDVLKTFQKQFWKLDLKPKKPRIHVKYLVVSFPSHSKRAFSVFLEC
jgi:hypothetical protein